MAGGANGSIRYYYPRAAVAATATCPRAAPRPIGNLFNFNGSLANKTKGSHAMQPLHRRVLIGVIFSLVSVVRWRREFGRLPTDASVDGGLPKPLQPHPQPQPQPQRQYKVFGFRPALTLQNSSSATLIPAADHEKDEAEVIWSARTKDLKEVTNLAAESMYVRLQRHGKIKPPDDTKLDAKQMKAALIELNFTQHELNRIDPDWQIFILDGSDGGTGVWPYWHMHHEMAPILGFGRINYATRSTNSDRFMDSWVAKMDTESNPGLSFEGFSGRAINFTAMGVDDGIENLLVSGCRSMQRLFMTVREDIVRAIDGYMKDNHPAAYEEASRSAIDSEDAHYRLSEAIAHLPRQTDVRTFWNASVCNMHCKFRNYMASKVASLPGRHPRVDIIANTDVVGFIHGRGRQMVHPDFIEGLMTTKIIVLAQRDRWEGHSRLYEALLSGALVMSYV